MLAIKTIIVSVLLISYFIIVKPYWDDVQSTSKEISMEIDELTKAPEPNDIELPMYFDFNSTEPLGKMGEINFAFILHLTYPNGSLIANDVIAVNATAVITSIVESLDSITLAFPNSLNYPIAYKENRLPAQGILVFENIFDEMPSLVIENTTIPSKHIFLVREANITFPIEGDYRPIIGLEFKDNSTKYFEAKNTILHVYPEEQLKLLETDRIDLESNLASLELSKAVFILSTIAVISIAVQIFSYNNDKCKYQRNKKEEQPKIIEKPKKEAQTSKKKNWTKKKKRRSKK